jgi:hypothetical protein
MSGNFLLNAFACAKPSNFMKRLLSRAQGLKIDYVRLTGSMNLPGKPRNGLVPLGGYPFFAIPRSLRSLPSLSSRCKHPKKICWRQVQGRDGSLMPLRVSQRWPFSRLLRSVTSVYGQLVHSLPTKPSLRMGMAVAVSRAGARN